MNATSERPGASRDPEQLERAAERLRADLDRTLDALERKLSPSQLLDRSLAYLREHGGDMAVARRRFGPAQSRADPAGRRRARLARSSSSVRTREPIDVTRAMTRRTATNPPTPIRKSRAAGSTIAWLPRAPGRVARSIEQSRLSKSARSCSAASQSRSARCSAP